MLARMLLTNTIGLPKVLTTLTASLVFVLKALPAYAQDHQYPHIAWVWRPIVIVTIVGLIIVLLAIIGVMVIFVWLVV